MKNLGAFFLVSFFAVTAFAQSRAVSCGPNCYTLDLNRDGKDDTIEFVYGGQDTLKIKISNVNPQPKYITVTESADTSAKWSLTVMDVNGDKQEDITCDWSPNGIRQFFNDGKGGFTDKEPTKVPARSTLRTTGPSSLRLEKR